jgi:ApbE superfamily uncharacterized protein (UPF0280 family)
MSYKKTVKLLQGGHVMAECGPMRLVITASVGKVPQPETGMKAAEESFLFLERIARLRHLLGRGAASNPQAIDDPLAREMFRSVMSTGDKDLTPMAAVAGVIGDAVADYLYERGMTKVVVNNGGDISVRLRGGEPVKVGIRPVVGEEGGTHVIRLDSDRSSWGIASSGVGGRSLTRGIASAVTIIAETASVADAAATAVANASFIEDEHVIQRPAEEIDPDTDIPGIPVTVRVGPLSKEKKSRALSSAMEKTAELVQKQIIFGAFVAVDGAFSMTDFFRQRLVAS